jgi:Protein of unknown function (DUF2917)
MILDMKRVIIELEPRGTVPVEDAAGVRIDCLRGRIWITEHRSPDDVILEAGESHAIARDGVTVVQALREAVISLRAPAVSPARGAFALWVERLQSRWASRAAARASLFVPP